MATQQELELWCYDHALSLVTRAIVSVTGNRGDAYESMMGCVAESRQGLGVAGYGNCGPRSKPLAFPGGAVSLPTPTRAALILSAKSWMRMAYETAETITDAETDRHRVRRKLLSQLERIEKALVELEGLDK